MVVRTRPGRVTVYQREIEAAFKAEWGDVRQNMRRAATFHLALAQRNAPKRTGAMALSIGYRILPAFEKYQTMYSMTVGADYAEYTLRDTGPRIFSSRPGGALLVRPIPYSRYTEETLRRSVRGYASRDWMDKAVRETFKGMRLN